MDELFFELIRAAIGTQESLSRIPSQFEWDKLLDIAVKQSLVGVCFVGLQALGADSDQGYERIGIGEWQYLNWMGTAAQIQQRNETLNQQCVALQKIVEEKGLRSCIFKGQAVASLYGVELQSMRQSGDIDIWIEGGKKRVIEFVHKFAPTKEVREAHARMDLFPDTEVEAHYRPGVIRNFVKNAKLQRFFRDQSDRCFENKISLGSIGEITAPTTEFNIVHQLTHIFHHLFTEGVGLRQIMDFYFVLKTKELNDSGILNVKNIVHRLGLERFASALMWVEGHVFGLPEIKMLWRPCEKDGRFLLNEILQSGNFGRYDVRHNYRNMTALQSLFRLTGKNLSLLRFSPFDWFWGPLWRVHYFIQRKLNGY